MDSSLGVFLAFVALIGFIGLTFYLGVTVHFAFGTLPAILVIAALFFGEGNNSGF